MDCLKHTQSYFPCDICRVFAHRVLPKGDRATNENTSYRDPTTKSFHTQCHTIRSKLIVSFEQSNNICRTISVFYSGRFSGRPINRLRMFFTYISLTSTSRFEPHYVDSHKFPIQIRITHSHFNFALRTRDTGTKFCHTLLAPVTSRHSLVRNYDTFKNTHLNNNTSFVAATTPNEQLLIKTKLMCAICVCDRAEHCAYLMCSHFRDNERRSMCTWGILSNRMRMNVESG